MTQYTEARDYNLLTEFIRTSRELLIQSDKTLRNQLLFIARMEWWGYRGIFGGSHGLQEERRGVLSSLTNKDIEGEPTEN